MLSSDNIKKIYNFEINKYKSLIKQKSPTTEIAEEKRFVEILGHILELSSEEIMRDMNV